MTIVELARRQRIEPLKSFKQLRPREPLFEDDEYAAFLEWLRKHREADIAVQAVVLDIDVVSAILRQQTPDTLRAA